VPGQSGSLAVSLKLLLLDQPDSARVWLERAARS